LRKINLDKNIQFCFKIGFSTLITAKEDEEYREAIISIHNGLELLMKYYLRKKDKLLIYRKITYKSILNKRNDLIKELDYKNDHTISYTDCIIRLEYFSKLPEKNKNYLTQLDHIRNGCVHFEYSYDEKELRKLLISHIYQFICDVIIEMGLKPKDFIPEKHLDTLGKLKNTIDDEIKQSYYAKIAAAKKHYNEELSQEEREQKAQTEDYTKKHYDIIVACPACGKNALLRKKIQSTRELLRSFVVIKRDLILRDLSCHYCGLSITDYDQLRLEFKDKEKSLQKVIYDYPDDCPTDCPDDYPDDCPTDCPDDYPDDCPTDCPDDYPDDCPIDCPDDYPDDCPTDYPDDCPDDCPR